MRKLRMIAALMTTAAMTVSVTACGNRGAAQTTAAAADSSVQETTAADAAKDTAAENGAADGKAFQVALMIGTGGLGDGGFNDSLLAGVKEAQEDYGVEYQLVEPKEISEFEADFTDLSASGKYDLIIGGGFDAVEALQKVAAEFPEQKYLFVDGEVTGCDNVTSITFKDNEKTYLVGTVAGLNTKTNKLGMIVGMDTPSQNMFVAGYMAGAKAANPDVEVIVKYVGSFSDTTTAKELALAEADAGADIIFAAAGGSGLGVFNAAQQGAFKAIGADVNQCLIDPDNIMLSAIRKIDVVIKDGIKAAIDGELEGGTQVKGLKENAVDITNDGSKVEISEDSLKAAEEAKEKIISGEITVPTTIDEVK